MKDADSDDILWTQSFKWKKKKGIRECNEAESAEDEQAGDDFKCESCDSTSTWKGGFNIHIG